MCSIQPQFYDDGLSLYTPQHVATESQRSEVNLKNNSCDLNGPSPKHSDPKSKILFGIYGEKQDLFYSLHSQLNYGLFDKTLLLNCSWKKGELDL